MIPDTLYKIPSKIPDHKKSRGKRNEVECAMKGRSVPEWS